MYTEQELEYASLWNLEFRFQIITRGAGGGIQIPLQSTSFTIKTGRIKGRMDESAGWVDERLFVCQGRMDDYKIMDTC